MQRGFLGETTNLRSLTLDDPIRHLEVVPAHRHRHVRPVLLVKRQHRAEVDTGEDVAVDDEQRFLRDGHQAERTACAQGLILPYVGQRHPEGVAVPEMLDDLLRLVMRHDVDAPDARLLQPLDDPLHQRTTTHRQHRLGNVLGQRPQSHPLSARHDHRLQREHFIGQKVVPSHQS